MRTVAAREQAKLLKREVDQGLDPLAARDERRTAPTVRDLIERYLTEHVPRLAPDSASDYRSMMMTYVMPTARIVLMEIWPRMTERLSSVPK